MGPTWDEELRLGHPHVWIAGVDEVGRGCLAGPVVAGAVILPAEIDVVKDPWILEITDSKQLTEKKRELLAPLIMQWCHAHALGSADVTEVDQLNIHYASHLAMKRAIEALGETVAHVLVDGKFIPKGLSCPATALIKGDSRSLSIACGSILAKVWRDRWMTELDQEIPGYFFSQHKGYSTAIHQKALKDRGVSAQHRRSFGPVKALL